MFCEFFNESCPTASAPSWGSHNYSNKNDNIRTRTQRQIIKWVQATLKRIFLLKTEPRFCTILYFHLRENKTESCVVIRYVRDTEEVE